MKKQTYIQPAIEVIDVELDAMLCASPSPNLTSAPEDDNVEFRSTGNRWGSMFDPSSEEE